MVYVIIRGLNSFHVENRTRLEPSLVRQPRSQGLFPFQLREKGRGNEVASTAIVGSRKPTEDMIQELEDLFQRS